MSFFPSNTLWLHIIGYQTNFYTAFRLGILFLLSYYLRKLFSVNHPAKISSFEPPMLPYVLPVIGHSLKFLKNSEELLERGRIYFGNNRIPFSLKLGGSTFYAIFNPQHVSQVFNAEATLSFDIFLQHIMKEFGSSNEAIRKILEIPLKPTYPSHVPKSVSQLAHQFQVEQTSGSNLHQLCQHITMFFQKSLFLEGVASKAGVSFFVDCGGKKCVSLKTWTAEVFIHAGQNAYFGERLLDISPDLPQVLMKLDDLSWQIFYNYPWFLRPELNRLSSRLRSSLEEYFRLPSNQRTSCAWFVQALEKEYLRLGLDTKDIAAQMLLVYWGINTNVSKVSYWIIAHLVFNESLIDIIRTESAPAFKDDGSIDVKYLAQSCPILNSIWLEALRVSASSTTMRYITQDEWLGNYLLRKGRALMISARQLHYDQTTFGANAANFDPFRFLNDPHLHRSNSFRPFGGGKTLCPGRHLSKWIVLSFVAIVFRRYDVRLAKPQPFPRYHESKPAIGIISGCDDLILDLKERI